MNIAWYGKKSMFFAMGCCCGGLLTRGFSGHEILCSSLIAIAIIVSGFARDTASADSYSFRGNRNED